MSRSVCSVVDRDNISHSLHNTPSQAILVTHTLTHFHPQFCNDVVLGRFPASLERLLKLAALRVQFLEGNYKLGATM